MLCCDKAVLSGYGPVTLSHHLVGVRRKIWFGLKHLRWSPETRLESSRRLVKKNPQTQLDISQISPKNIMLKRSLETVVISLPVLSTYPPLHALYFTHRLFKHSGVHCNVPLVFDFTIKMVCFFILSETTNQYLPRLNWDFMLWSWRKFLHEFSNIVQRQNRPRWLWLGGLDLWNEGWRDDQKILGRSWGGGGEGGQPVLILRILDTAVESREENKRWDGCMV